MLLPSPSETRNALWEAPLALDATAGPERGAPGADTIDAAREMPVVRIEPPVAHLARDVIPPAELPEQIRSDSAHCYIIVRFDCSFRPRADKVRIEWARFRAQLKTDAAGDRAVAEDVHPYRVERTLRRNVALKISPTITFLDIDVGLGEYSSGSDYDVLEPVIEAAGRGGDDVSWDYSGGRDEFVSGGKRMHALVRIPVAVTALDVLLEVSADLRVDRRVLWPAKRSHDEPPIRVRLWS